VNNTGVTDGNVEVDIDNGTRAHFSCERTLSIRGYFYPHPLAEHWNKIIKVFMRMLGLTHTPDEAEKHVLKQMGVANVLRYSYAHMLRAQKAHRHRTEYAPRVAHAAHALLQTDAFLGSAQNTTQYESDRFAGIANLHHSVDNLSLYKRLNQPLKAHKKEAKRVGINLVDPRHELISKIQASAPKEEEG